MLNDTPFKHLINNIDKVDIICPIEIKEQFQNLFILVLEKLDDFFIKNNLYKSIDYKSVVEKIVTGEKSVFQLVVRNNEQDQLGGFVGGLDKKVYVNYDVVAEKKEEILCHEFLHFLTKGIDELNYCRKGHIYKICQHYEGKNHIIQEFMELVDGEYRPRKIQYGMAILLCSPFINEGLTMYSTNKVYNKKLEGYEFNVEFVLFISKIIGNNSPVFDYLHRDLSDYAKFLGLTACKKLTKLGVEFEDACSQDNVKDAKTIADNILKIVFKALQKKLSEISYEIKPDGFINLCNSIALWCPSRKLSIEFLNTLFSDYKKYNSQGFVCVKDEVLLISDRLSSKIKQTEKID